MKFLKAKHQLENQFQIRIISHNYYFEGNYLASIIEHVAPFHFGAERKRSVYLTFLICADFYMLISMQSKQTARLSLYCLISLFIHQPRTFKIRVVCWVLTECRMRLSVNRALILNTLLSASTIQPCKQISEKWKAARGINFKVKMKKGSGLPCFLLSGAYFSL